MKLSSQLLYINLSVFLISTSGIFGRLVTLSPELTIFYRCVLASVVLYLYLRFIGKRPFRRGINYPGYIITGGILMAIHWVGYFYALSLSSIAIAMLTLHTHPAMTSLLEPIILKTRFKAYHLVLALIILVGIWFIMPDLNFGNKVVWAVAAGLVSALSFSLRNIWTRKIMKDYDASSIMLYHLIIMSALLIPFGFIHNSDPLLTEWHYIVALALLITVLGHTLFVNALKHFTASTVSLLSSVIPIYGIIWGIILLDEIPELNTIIGGILILSTFVIESYISQRKMKNAR